jgi:hypothetical protein
MFPAPSLATFSRAKRLSPSASPVAPAPAYADDSCSLSTLGGAGGFGPASNNWREKALIAALRSTENQLARRRRRYRPHLPNLTKSRQLPEVLQLHKSHPGLISSIESGRKSELHYAALSEDLDESEFNAESGRDEPTAVAVVTGEEPLELGLVEESQELFDKAIEGTEGADLRDESMPISLHTKSPVARSAFFRKYHDVARHSDLGDGDESELTPRSLFLRRLLQLGALPVPILLRDSSDTSSLNLSHRGMGDSIFAALVEVLPRLPPFVSLNVADNHLTDVSLVPLCRWVVEVPRLQLLDLSNNKVDEAAEIVRGYLMDPSCCLGTLVLRSADIDDGECVHLMSAVKNCSSLTSLDISCNLIGDSEALNTVNPDLFTGGEAIADCLASNPSLRRLNLAWNGIRRDSAVELGKALAHNTILEELSLAHNAFADEGTQHLGDSLRSNITLKKLDLSYNRVPPRAALVLGSALHSNTTVRSVNLDGNRLGRAGSSSLMKAILRRRRLRDEDVKKGGCEENWHRLEISMGFGDNEAEEGTSAGVSSEQLFDATRPAPGAYRLDMGTPYGRMVVGDIMMLAESRRGFEIASLAHNGVPIPLFHEELGKDVFSTKCSVRGAVLATLLNSASPSEMIKLLEALGLSTTGDPERMIHLFEAVPWVTVSSEKDIIPSLFRTAFELHDADHSGALDRQELISVLKFMGAAHSEAHCEKLICTYDADGSGLVDLEEFVSWCVIEFVSEPPAPKGRLISSITGKPWGIPREGWVNLSAAIQRLPSSELELESDEGLQELFENIHGIRDASEQLRLVSKAIAASDVKLSGHQALRILEMMQRAGIGGDIISSCRFLLPQVLSPAERAIFLDAALEAPQKLKLCISMRGAFGALMGNPSGHYCLDLSNDADALIAARLCEVSNYSLVLAGENKWPDTSQKGNRMGFRNERWRSNPVDVTGEWLSRRHGILQFDYVMAQPAPEPVTPMSNRRLQSLFSALSLESMRAIRDAYTEAEKLASGSSSDQELGEQLILMNCPAIAKTLSVEMPATPSCINGIDVLTHWNQFSSSSFQAQMNYFSSSGSKVHSAPAGTPTKMYRNLYHKLQELQVRCCSLWFSAEQALEIINLFPIRDGGKVQALIALFSRTIENNELCGKLAEHLTPLELVEVRHRLGWLNTTSPMLPDGYYELNLRCWEQREICKVLIALAVAEEGENWVGETFRHDRGSPPLDGWMLPGPWCRPDEEDNGQGGPRRSGILQVAYSTDEALGCMANNAARRSLLRRFLAGARRMKILSS